MNTVEQANPEEHHTRRRRVRRGTAVALSAAVLTAGSLSGPAFATNTADEVSDWDQNAYRGSVEVVDAEDGAEAPDTISGIVFDDADQSSSHGDSESGVEGVTVSNGRDVTTTDADGRYELPVYENMTVFVTQPQGYQVPVDEQNVAQFHYHHLPEGSPDLEYGGIDPTGPLPAELNFPLSQDDSAAAAQQECAIGGDIQTYTEEEVDFARAGAFADLAQRSGYETCGALFVGDNVGDDPSLFPQVRGLTEMINGPARFLPGNHDPDMDATEQEHAFDSYRNHLGPEYYSYDVGDAHFVALNNVEYPFEGDTSYDGAIDDDQMEWLRQDIAQVPEDKLIVLSAHIPLLGFADQSSTQHQTEEVNEIYELLEGREAISLAGHVHAIENMREGDSLAAWEETYGVEELPFTHITAGAISGDWYSGEMLEDGYPTAVQRDGSYPGVLTLDIDGNQVSEYFTRTGDDGSHQMNLGLNTPAYRDWFDENSDNAGEADEFAAPDQVETDELGETWLTTNFFMGATGSTVEVAIDGQDPVEAERTQAMQGEEQLVGAEYSDPVATQQQLVHGGSIADRSSHIWRLPVPEDLEEGEHSAEVTATDVHGREHTQSLTFHVGESDDSENSGDIPVEADIPGLDEGGEEDGSLVMSVSEGTASLEGSRDDGDRVSVSGVMPAVSVTDTRAQASGWSVTGQSAELSSGDDQISADHLGWAPNVVESSNGVAAGDSVESVLSGGEGLAAPQTLGSGNEQTRAGTTEMDAELNLEVPVDTAGGTYQGAVSVSLFPQD